MTIKFCDLSIPDNFKKTVWKKSRSLLVNNDFILGKEVDYFEKSFAKYCESNFCLGVSSGCDAILWIMQGLGIGKGDEVITVANTFIGTVLPIVRSGATPVLVDCDAVTQQIDPMGVEAAITSKTAAIVAVHLYGRLAPMNDLKQIADKYGLLILEDAAQAHGARYKGKRAGSVSRAAGFSFYPAKNLGAWGDGGAITTSDPELAGKLSKIRNYGQEKKYQHTELGWNSRLDTFQAIVLTEKLKLLDQWNQKRRIIAHWYFEKLKDLEITTFHEESDNEAVYHLFVITVQKRDMVIRKLEEDGIPCGIHYPVPIHKHACFCDLSFATNKTFPNAEKQANELLSLPMHPNLSEDDVSHICSSLKFIM